MAHIQYEPISAPVLDGPSIPPPILSWAPVYPDQLHRRRELNEYPYLSWAPGIIDLVVPDGSWQPSYPDWFPPIPQQDGFFAQNVEPIAQPTPELSWQPHFPSLLLREPQGEGFFVQNIDPISEPVPELTQVIFDDVLLPRPPPYPPSFFHVDLKQVHAVLEDYSRGLHVGDIRGFYHTQPISMEPYACVEKSGVQTIANTTVTLVTSWAVTIDNWNLFDSANNRFVINHDGWYLVGGGVRWEADADGYRRMYIQLTGSSSDRIVESIGAATPDATVETIHSMPINPVQLFRGDSLQLFVEHSALNDLDVQAGNKSTFWLIRMAKTTQVLPS